MISDSHSCPLKPGDLLLIKFPTLEGSPTAMYFVVAVDLFYVSGPTFWYIKLGHYAESKRVNRIELDVLTQQSAKGELEVVEIYSTGNVE